MLTSALVKVLMGSLLCGLARFKDIKMALIMLKQLLKRCLGIDQKNFIMFLLRHIAVLCKVESIYAVSDEGFYANTHLVRGHRAKVAELDPLWEESGGVVCSDDRFFNIPLEEYRKPIEEIKSQNVANTENAMNYSINMSKRFKII